MATLSSRVGFSADGPSDILAHREAPVTIGADKEREEKSSADDLLQNKLFRITENWRGQYAEALKLPSNHMEAKCCICLEDYNSTDEVVVFNPCMHGVHNACFLPLAPSKCPFDNGQVNPRLHFLGNFLFIPSTELQTVIQPLLSPLNERIKDLARKSLFFQTLLIKETSGKEGLISVLRRLVEEFIEVYRESTAVHVLIEKTQRTVEILIKELSALSPLELEELYSAGFFSEISKIREEIRNALEEAEDISDLSSRARSLRVATLYFNDIYFKFLGARNSEVLQIIDNKQYEFLRHFNILVKLPPDKQIAYLLDMGDTFAPQFTRFKVLLTNKLLTTLPKNELPSKEHIELNKIAEIADLVTPQVLNRSSLRTYLRNLKYIRIKKIDTLHKMIEHISFTFDQPDHLADFKLAAQEIGPTSDLIRQAIHQIEITKSKEAASKKLLRLFGVGLFLAISHELYNRKYE